MRYAPHKGILRSLVFLPMLSRWRYRVLSLRVGVGIFVLTRATFVSFVFLLGFVHVVLVVVTWI